MRSKVEGVLEVGTNGRGEVVINHPDLKPDENGVGHIVFSPSQAQQLATILRQKAKDAALESEALKPPAPTADRSQRTLVDGSPVTEGHRELNLNGQQKDYVVLSPEERAKGFVRPVRRSYRHLKCGTVTTMAPAIAETYARDPGFYNGTFCVGCRTHLPLDEFVWDGTTERVGS